VRLIERLPLVCSTDWVHVTRRRWRRHTRALPGKLWCIVIDRILELHAAAKCIQRERHHLLAADGRLPDPVPCVQSPQPTWKVRLEMVLVEGSNQILMSALQQIQCHADGGRLIVAALTRTREDRSCLRERGVSIDTCIRCNFVDRSSLRTWPWSTRVLSKRPYNSSSS
jgi:hypothetical protein